MVLPSKRTLQLFKSRIPGGDGYRKDVFKELAKTWGEKAKRPEDWDCILSWDATGFKKMMKFNDGVLEGFSYDPQSFSMHQMFADKVNCFMVTSPEKNIRIKCPVAYYHCTTLDSAAIRRQWYEVMTGLDSVGFNIVGLVCDGASEHFKFFNQVLTEFSIHDPTLLVRRGHMWAVSDPPHLIKKFRNNWLSSGQQDRHTKRLLIGGHHIGWSVIEGTHRTSTTLPDGSQRATISLRKMKHNVVDPSSIQRLRVSLAAIPFSKEVQDFVRSNIDRVAQHAGVTVDDVKATLEFSSNANEIFQIMNSTEPITWTDELDSTGTPIGLRDKLDLRHGFTLNWFSKKYGVRVESLIQTSGLPSGDSIPPPDSVLIIDRLQRLVTCANYFKGWKHEVDALPGYTKEQLKTMFISHWLYTDLRRTCYSIVELMRHYVSNSSRCWLLRRFTQDPIESLFGTLRTSAGSNSNLDRTSVDFGMSERRAKCFKKK